MEINGLDLKDILAIVNRKKGRYLALILSELESKIPEDEWVDARKCVLDYFNDFTRSIVRSIIGQDVEGL